MIVTCCRFHKYFMLVTFSCSTCTMQCFQNALAYFAAAISYRPKMFMKSTPVTNVKKLFTTVSYDFT
jgi:hypothetical protein